MQSQLLEDLAAKAVTKQDVYRRVEENWSLLQEVLSGVSSSKATVRYGCGSALMDLSSKHPKKVYPHMDSFLALLDSKYRILKWQAHWSL